VWDGAAHAWQTDEGIFIGSQTDERKGAFGAKVDGAGSSDLVCGDGGRLADGMGVGIGA
jgi:hypothetical protein